MIITREQFKNILNRFFKSKKLQDKLYDLLHINLFDSEISDNEGWLFDRLLECIIKEQYLDLVYDYIFPQDNINLNGWDRPENPLKLYDSSDESIIIASIATLDDLYNYLFANNGFRTDYRTSNKSNGSN